MTSWNCDGNWLMTAKLPNLFWVKPVTIVQPNLQCTALVLLQQQPKSQISLCDFFLTLTVYAEPPFTQRISGKHIKTCNANYWNQTPELRLMLTVWLILYIWQQVIINWSADKSVLRPDGIYYSLLKVKSGVKRGALGDIHVLRWELSSCFASDRIFTSHCGPKQGEKYPCI